MKYGGQGGGAFQLNVAGTLTNNGTMSANGATGPHDPLYPSGGGAGGSIYIIADTIAGTGVFEALGGDGGIHTSSGWVDGSGGGGGRIAVYFNNDSSSSSSSVAGGTGNQAGQAGTVVWLQQ